MKVDSHCSHLEETQFILDKASFCGVNVTCMTYLITEKEPGPQDPNDEELLLSLKAKPLKYCNHNQMHEYLFGCMQ